MKKRSRITTPGVFDRRPKTERNCQKIRAGAAVTEFAIVAPFLVLILLGAIDVGQAVNVAQIVNDASREGARWATRADVTDASQVDAAVQNYLAKAFPNSDGSSIHGAVSVTVSDDTGTLPGGDLSTIGSGQPVGVQVTLDYDSVRWTSWFAWLNGTTLRTTTVMRRE